MKKLLKGLGTAFVLILLGALIYYVSATVYYKSTGDSHHSGMLGLRCTMIYVIILLIDGFIRRMPDEISVKDGYDASQAGRVDDRGARARDDRVYGQ